MNGKMDERGRREPRKADWLRRCVLRERKGWEAKSLQVMRRCLNS